MQVLFEKQGTAISAMAIKDSKITHLNLRRKLEILDALVGVFHMISLAHILNDGCVESLHKKLQLPDTKCVLRLKCS